MAKTSETGVRIDEALAGFSWPEAVPMTALPASGDTVVVCAGFEDRARAFVDRAVAQCSGLRVVVISYLPVVVENHEEEFGSLLRDKGADVRVVYYDRAAPPSALTIFQSALPTGAVWIDVSGMSRLLICQLLALVVQMRFLRRARVVYSEAEDYPPTRLEFEATYSGVDRLSAGAFVSSGVFELSVVPELSSVSMQGQPVRAVVFPSFNVSQLVAVCSELQASSYTVVNGWPPREELQWRHDAIRRINSVEAVNPREEITVGTLDYRDALRALLTVYGRCWATEKIVISPTGSKMQSVAVGLLCGFLGDLQVVYPAPKSFMKPETYTRGARHPLVLSLESMAELAESFGV